MDNQETVNSRMQGISQESISADDVKKNLEEQNFEILECHRMTPRRTKTDLPLFLATVSRNNRKIFKVTTCMDLKIKVEAQRPQRGLVSQCHKCQWFVNAQKCCHSTVSYVVRLFKKSFKRDLEEGDLYEVLSRCSSKRCGDKLEKQWRYETEKNTKPSLARMVWRRFGWRYIRLCTINVSWKIFRTICEPYAITNLISYFKPGQTEMTIYDAYFYGAWMISLKLGQRLYLHNYILCVQQLGVEIKASFTSLLYRKALKLTPTAVSEITIGNIVTLITKDVQTFKESVWIISDVSSGLVQICVISYLIFAKVGITSLFGIGILIAALPIQAIIGRWINKLRQKTGKRTDERLQVTQESLSAIKIIKMYTWEKFFADKINAARQNEVNKMILGFYLRAVLLLVGVLSTNLGLYILVTAYIWLGFPTDTTIVFYLLTNFKTLRKILGNDIPWNIGRSAELVSAVTRINKVIKAEEWHPNQFAGTHILNPEVELKGATVHMGNEEILSNVSLKLDSGLTVVTGSIGSGKSTFLKTILKDYPLTSGEVISNGNISYASQEPWLFPSTIKQNILFGEKYDTKRYEDVIRVCALQLDFNLLEKSDGTIVTDGGLNLSKGQRTRINLARAVYKDSDIYLLDDSLSALDGPVQDHIFNECIKSYLKGKICVLTSQMNNHINGADNVVIMDKGRIKYSGYPKPSILPETDFERDLKEEVVGEDNDETEENENSNLLETESLSGKRIYKEVKKEGKVSIRVYRKYMIFGGGFIILLINLTLGGVAQTSESYADKLLTRWVDEKQKVLNLKEDSIRYQTIFPQTLDSTTTNYFPNQTILLEAETQANQTFTIYSLMLLAATVLILITTYANFDFCRRASVNIHKALVGSVIKANMFFFDSHFIGNVLNRFSEDLAQIDENLPFIFRECLKVMFSTIGQIGLILTVDKSFILFIVIVIIILLFLEKAYMPAGRSLKRLEAAARSPMVGHLNATLEGLATIRAYKAENILVDEFDRHQDLYTSAYYTSICSMRAFTFFMDCTGCTLIIAVVTKFLFFDTGASAGNVGLALTQVSLLGDTIQWGLRKWSVMENYMTSAERLLEYTEVEPEDGGGKIVKDWPNEGGVKFENVSLAYSKKTVLKNLCFEIDPKQTIGIVGRTGAGKSSLVSTMFRLYDFHGKILIDGVDIKTLSLKLVRRSLGVIPQDPVMFRGTVRSNLDPLGEFKDEELWNSLEKVNMKDSISNLNLEMRSDNDFSSGQKQLFCLARAILRKNKIVILDEASANMDHETDEMVHNIIKQYFEDCTMFMIAHRLHSVLKCHKVMVLDKGIIVEFDDLSTLLKNRSGIFYKMVEQAGLLHGLSNSYEK